METKIDLRVLKTHNKITEALGAMMTETTFDNITVYDLCARAGIRRATFYKHFEDKYDLLAKVVTVIIDNINKKVIASIRSNDTVKYLSLFSSEVIAYFEERPNILSNILDSSAFPTLYEIITNSTHKSLVDTFDSAKEHGAGLIAPTDVLATFINGGIAGILFNWFKTRSITRDELIASLEVILKKLFV